MDLKELKQLCYSANAVTHNAELNEKQIKITFIKEYFFKNLKEMRVSEGGCSLMDINDKFVRVGVDKELAVVLAYDPQMPKNSSTSGISVFTEKAREISIEYLNLQEISHLFTVLSMNVK